MKKIILLLILISMKVNAIEVCGVPFGSSYQETYKVLTEKWGKPTGSDFEEIVYMNKLYAGDYWDIIIFRFQGGGGKKTAFNCCLFGKEFKTLSEAEKFRDYLAKELAKKYKIFSKTDEYGLKYYLGGQNPVNPNEAAWGLDISGTRVRLIYGPYNYLDESY